MSMAVREKAWTLVVPHHAGGARLARQRLAAELGGLITPNLMGDVVTVVAEPLPGGVIRLTVHVGPAVGSGTAYVLLRVTDGGAERSPAARAVGPESVDGRGLAIVAALARRWGVERSDDVQCVWAELGTPRP